MYHVLLTCSQNVPGPRGRKEPLPLPGWIKEGFGEERIAGLGLKDVTELVGQKHRRKDHQHCTSQVWSPEYIHRIPAS